VDADGSKSCLSPGAHSSQTSVLHRFSAKEPYISAEEPYVSRKESCISTKEPYASTKSPTYPAKLSLSWCTLLTDLTFAQVLRKIALRFRKRALYLCQRSLYFHKRALCFHKEPYITATAVFLLVHSPQRR